MIANSTPTPRPPEQPGGSASRAWRHPGGRLIEEGAHALTQDQLLAILIGSGAPHRPALSIAKAILDDYVGLYGLHQRATNDGLRLVPGLNPVKVIRIAAALEIAKRVANALS